jgi:hypothetical protein
LEVNKIITITITELKSGGGDGDGSGGGSGGLSFADIVKGKATVATTDVVAKPNSSRKITIL